ncbi:MAG TPA: hypothetical protein VNM90_30070 [Haliangium sp.]|nr:hypothetical protein [Haliangium sp.]
MQSAEPWQLHLTLPRGADTERIPGPIWDLLVILVHAYAARAPAAPGSRAAGFLDVPLEHPTLWLDEEVAVHLRVLLEDLVGCRQRIVPGAGATAGAVRCEVTAAEPQPSAPPSAVLAFRPDLDSVAALAQWAGEPPGAASGQPPGAPRAARGAGDLVLVGIEIGARASANAPACERVMARLFRGFAPRVASLALIPPAAHASQAQDAPPDGWRLLHVVATAAVAMALGAAEACFHENGVANLGLPVTLSSLAQPAAQPLHPALTAALSHLLGRLSGFPFQIRNPFAGHTPAEVAEHVLAAAGAAGGVDEICDLVHAAGQPERAMDQCIAALGVQLAAVSHVPAGPMPGALGAPMNENLADAYVRALRELPALSDVELLPRLLSQPAAHGPARRRDSALLVDLARRHGVQAQRALIGIARAWAHHLVAGTLAPTSLLVRAVLPGRSVENAAPARLPLFRKCADRWEIWFEDGAPVYLNDSRGLAYIHLLLQEPGRAYAAAELRACIAGHYDVPSGALGEHADRQAIRAYKTRLDHLRAELEVANDNHDLGQRQRIEEELEAIEAELRRCLTPTGRLRHASELERARKAVSIAVHRTLRRIEEVHPRLARHLDASLHIGVHLSYLPPRPMSWVTA